MLHHRTGDLFDADDLDALAHGVNCAGAMGAGIAVEFRRRWPQMYSAYQMHCRQGHLEPGGLIVWESFPGPLVYNLATQRHWNTPATAEAVRDAFALGGLEWSTVEDAIKPLTAPSPVEFIVFTPRRS
jgi:O-acetyl-ADP-ribose deacetylase (regulator of RNase III)